MSPGSSALGTSSASTRGSPTKSRAAKPWDVAGAGVVLQCAGGLLTDPEGGSWIHSAGGYVAGNPSLHQWALRAIKYVKQHPDPV